ncbi:hypothetical protein sscle_13g092410 [Sclerotinia sclerotiorum 1980 UF-70]|uniref:Uncharacterized protein n=1 Tax=Sclerotinia sclerotiorum (strain ATCC 18683 / 1980 / Ss-1) TaxID=665079 RepID=A0A1D9QHU7_SCLS1|nr:hypothetical protein sscle_13g092410 [Sclerotinia sclerotiorum 1980 UF-70]
MRISNRNDFAIEAEKSAVPGLWLVIILDFLAKHGDLNHKSGTNSQPPAVEEF